MRPRMRQARRATGESELDGIHFRISIALLASLSTANGSSDHEPRCPLNIRRDVAAFPVVRGLFSAAPSGRVNFSLSAGDAPGAVTTVLRPSAAAHSPEFNAASSAVNHAIRRPICCATRPETPTHPHTRDFPSAWRGMSQYDFPVRRRVRDSFQIRQFRFYEGRGGGPAGKETGCAIQVDGV